ncbi:alpha/beta fold hydrolase [Microvirga yunnanensis]|uniref:alpha/beta fold hydrolase n=1 Tax=Microvirga yunnanensis TaxID=2953740 RepID=UPI0021CA30F9|nr:alpha/beta hydrolase [Microvirga sp. HBU65207]
MTRAKAQPTGAVPEDLGREPDRTGNILGLSKSGFHEIAYVEWGPADTDDVVICVHGLTRQGRDFDYLASALAARGRRVVCPDLAGRGRSAWLRDPADYTVLQYCADMNALIARTGARTVDWVGTSLGGLIGIVLAGLPDSPIRRLVINDIGPVVPTNALHRIGRYVADMPETFDTFDDAEQYLREVLAPFGNVADEHWRHLTQYSVRWDPEQDRYLTLCDPAILQALRAPANPGAHLWAYWDAIGHPILVVRGRESDFLPSYLSNEMARRNRNAIVHDVPGCGHAPTLMPRDQIEAVVGFLMPERNTRPSGPTPQP